MPERERIGGHVVVESLEVLGVSQVFGLPGQHALGLFEALSDSAVELVAGRVENNVVFNADGYARVTGRTGVVVLSTGPGALTSLGALQEAWASNVPLLVLVSQVPRWGLGGSRNGLLHQLDDQQLSARNVTKQTYLVTDAEQVPDVLARAWSLARSAPAGPVWVELPQDLLLEPTQVAVPADLTGTPATLEPAEAQVEEVAALLAAAERPVLLAGGGVRRSPGGPEALVNLAERLDAPVVSTAGGKGAIGFDHPLSAGSWIEDGHTTELLADADVLLAIGTALGEVTSNYFTLRPRGRLVQIDADARVLGSNLEAVGVHADAAAALTALAATLPRAEHRDGAGRAATLRRRVEDRLAGQGRETELGLLHDLREALPAEVPTFWDMTIAGYWAWSAWDPRGGAFESAQGAGGLGYAFPAALGAAAGTGRRAVAVSGDGGALYSIAELATAQQHNIDVTWLVIDDGGYGILREYLTDAFGRSTATELARPDFLALAESFGVAAHRATLADVGEVVAATLHTPGPSVVVLPTHLRMFAPTHR